MLLIFKGIMKKLIISGLVVIGLVLGIGVAMPRTPVQVKWSVPRHEQYAILTASKLASQFTGDHAKRVWPGYDLTSAPIVLTFDTGHTYAFNLQKGNSQWNTLKLNQQEVLYSEEDQWGVNEVSMNPEFPIDNQSAFVFSLQDVQNDPVMPFFTLIHERFHTYQFNHFSQEEGRGSYQDHLNPENLALMQLEELILADFLKTINQPETAQNHLKDFVAVHKTRVALLQPSSVVWERHQQRMEGLADYVSTKALDEFPLFPISGKQHLQNTLQSFVEDDNVSDRAIKWRHYAVGATLGYALDFMQAADWKTQVEQGMALDSVLERISIVSNEDLNTRIAHVKEKYHFETILTQVSTNLNAYQTHLNGVLKDFAEQKGISIVVHKPSGTEISGGGSDLHKYYLADGTTLSLENSSISVTSDNQWRVSLNNMPFMLQGDDGKQEFKVEDGLQINLDEENYEMQELIKNNIEKQFTTIAWEGQKSSFGSHGHPGTLRVNDGKVYITYE